jgi:hypothetical protein
VSSVNKFEDLIFLLSREPHRSGRFPEKMELTVHSGAVTTEHSLDIDSVSSGHGWICAEHRSFANGGPHVLILRIPFINYTWCLQYRGCNIVSRIGAAITFHNCEPIPLDGSFCIHKASVSVFGNQNIIEIVLDKLDSGCELYFHCGQRFPGKTFTVTTYPLRTDKIG